MKQLSLLDGIIATVLWEFLRPFMEHSSCYMRTSVQKEGLLGP